MTAEPSQPDENPSEQRPTSELFQLAYKTLHHLAADYLHRERPNHTLQATALVHEAYLKLQRAERPVDWQGKTHFQAVAASAMRQILVDHARARATQKRGGEWQRISLSSDVLGYEQAIDLVALDEAMRKLNELDPRKCQVVELRFFGGMTNREAAEQAGVSSKTAEADWYFARAWLRDKLSEAQ